MRKFTPILASILCALSVGCGDRSASAHRSDPGSMAERPVQHAEPSVITPALGRGGPSAASVPHDSRVSGQASTPARREGADVMVIDWHERAQRLQPGATRAEVEIELPPRTKGPGGSFEPVLELPRRGASTVVYPLDDRYQAEVDYTIDKDGLYLLSSVRVTPLSTHR
jgi:hypothetical protein